MALPDHSLLFSLIPQNLAAETAIENLGNRPFFSVLPDPRGQNGSIRVVCVRSNPSSASGLEPSFPGHRNGPGQPDRPFRFILNKRTGEVLLEDFSDGQAFRFTGPNAIPFPNPPHPRRLMIDCCRNLEFECLEEPGSWSKWAVFWHQTPPAHPPQRPASTVLTDDDGSEVYAKYKKIPDSGDDLVRYTDRDWSFASKFGAPRVVVDTGTGQYLAVRKVSYPFKIEARRSMLERIINDSKLSHPHIITYFQVQETPASIDILMPVQEGDLLWLMEHYQNPTDNFPPLVNPDEIGQLLLGQMLLALDYLESKGVIHHKVCPGNILVNIGLGRGENATFQLSNFEYGGFKSTSLYANDPCFRAPEACGLTDSRESPRTDIWGLCATMAYFLDPDFRGFVSSKPSDDLVANAVCLASELFIALRGMGEWDANDRPSARQKLEEVFGEDFEG
ncbi:hypothetical protein NCS52_00412800 [Fusarium sp. LHS14.1]|nr:hypothetical protein NCS52_00412800 [Fusarium sp. LHS14.1]